MIPTMLLRTFLVVSLALLLALSFGLMARQVLILAQDESGTIPSLRLLSPGPGELVITWEKPNSPSRDPSDYRVSWVPVGQSFLSYRWANEADRGNSYPDGADTRLTLTGLPKGLEYKVQMRSRYYDGEFTGSEKWSGPWSDVKTQRVRDDPPAAPTDLTASPVFFDSVSLRWTAPTHDGLTGYRILRGPDAASLAAIVEDTGNIGTDYTDSSVVSEITYVYAVAALSVDGYGQPSGTVEVTTPPPAPTGLEAISKSRRVVLTWDDPEDAWVTGYRILRGPSAEELTILAEVTGSEAPQYVDTAVEPPATYYYAVQALNAGGTGPQSTPVSAQPPVEPVSQRAAGAQDEGSTVAHRRENNRQTEVVAVSNLGKALSSHVNLAGGTGVALSFSTGSKRYVLSKVRADLSSISAGRIESLLYSDDSGAPDSRLLSLGGPDNPESNIPGNVGDFAQFSGYDDFSSNDYILAANSTYWVVFQETAGGGPNTARALYRYASTHDEDSGAIDGWSMGNVSYTRNSWTSDFEEGSSAALPVMAIFVKNLTAVTETSVMSTPLDGDTYRAGENLEVQVTFDGPVTLVSGGLSLEVGSNTRTASLAGGNGTTQLLFYYWVQSSDSDADGFKVKANGLSSATITATDSVVSKDFAEVDAGSSHKVDGGTAGCQRAWCADMEVNEVVSGSVFGFVDYGPGTALNGSLSNRVADMDGSVYVVDQLLVRNGNRLEILLDRTPEQVTVQSGARWGLERMDCRAW